MTLINTAHAYYKVNIVTDLEAMALRINIGKPITLCNIYITPEERINCQQILNLIAQLPRPFILFGDFNARSPVWGDTTANIHGEVIEDILNTTDVCILNTGAHTHLHKQTGITTAIDLALSSPDIVPEREWQVELELSGATISHVSLK